MAESVRVTYGQSENGAFIIIEDDEPVIFSKAKPNTDPPKGTEPGDGPPAPQQA